VAVDEVPVPQDPAQHTYPTQPIPAAEMPGSPNELVPHDPTQPQAWSGLTAPNGTPYVFATQPFTPYDASTYVVGPSTGVSWPENAYSPITGDIYMCANQGEGATASLPADDIHVIAGVPGSFGQIHVSSPLYTGSAGNLIAMNPANQDIMWRVNTPGVTCSSQVIATAGGIVLIGRADGTIDAFDALTGAEDWSFQTGSTSLPRIGVFGIHGQEYLTAQGTSIVNGATTYWLNAYTLPS
jgi:outer membrane protein assembly factor BamB